MSKLQKLKDFKENRSGIFWNLVIGVVVMIVATLVWLVAIIVTQQFTSVFDALSTTHNSTIALGETLKTQGAAVIVVIDVGMVIWILISAFRIESQEQPTELF